MTAQIKNSILYKGKKYIVLNTHPSPDYYYLNILNINLSEPHTACKRGYIAKYKIQNNLLKLLQLDIFPSKTQNVRLNNRLPSSFNDGWEVYKSLYLEIPFTGEMEIYRNKITTRNILSFDTFIEHCVFFKLHFFHGIFKNVKDITADKASGEFNKTNDFYEEIPDLLRK